MTFLPLRHLNSGLRYTFASACLLVMLSGCRSEQDAALEHAKQQAASTGQPAQGDSTDNDWNTVTTVVQPPPAGQKDLKEEVITTTVTPKAQAAGASGADGASGV